VTLEIESWLHERRAKLKTLHKHWSERLLSDVAVADKAMHEAGAARDADSAHKAQAEARLAESKAYVLAVEERKAREKERRERIDLEMRTAVRIQVGKKRFIYATHYSFLVLVEDDNGEKRPRPLSQGHRDQPEGRR